eukprot:CAMPEP_0181203670 /NCGR_PEP_ID=MMETSP1096-20121128/19519_1 /TAXON_ID=156174 ORGANISM="Chrysochromulina ericina, Strain CCMP281" /NCGR_SAMPLE_ID=MMETSP1096 /ASSEMBLY_ACC=CAM_ASM_000453 /LENGTH=352 /DNA_ID=CAMNT_0023294305 /DNA_START=41 /DNA_END=1099 /DNA_ORIENTATION=-
MSTEWTRYPKMAESSQGWQSVPKGEWVATEKVHGANFSIVADASGCVRFYKRSGPVANSEDFFGFRSQGLELRLSQCALRLFAARGGMNSVAIFGELCGGRFPHPSVRAVPSLQPVQCGVWYSPGLTFVVFDIATAGPGAAERRFLDFDLACAVAESAGFLFVQTVARGTLQECLDAPVRFDSRLSARLGLPSLPTPNWAEGVVIRAVHEAQPGGSKKGGSRALFKRKIEEFGETQYKENGWCGNKVGGTAGAALPLADSSELVRYEMQASITRQRLASVTSKLGHVDAHNKAQCRELLDAFHEDIIEALDETGVIESAEQLTTNAALMRELECASRQLVGAYVRELRKVDH